jgi:hypothetical protein
MYTSLPMRIKRAAAEMRSGLSALAKAFTHTKKNWTKKLGKKAAAVGVGHGLLEQHTTVSLPEYINIKYILYKLNYILILYTLLPSQQHTTVSLPEYIHVIYTLYKLNYLLMLYTLLPPRAAHHRQPPRKYEHYIYSV